EVGDVFESEVTPRSFGRIAAQTAKHVVVQRIREAERNMVYDQYATRKDDIVTATVLRTEGKNVFVDLGKTEALLAPSEQIPRENYRQGSRLKVYILEVRKTTKGPQIMVSRTHPGLLKCLFEREVPEIHDGTVEIKSVVREPGWRSKIAVYSKNSNVDPVGACVGAKGMRVQAIVNELDGEKIEVIRWDENPAIYVSNALSPAKVISVEIDEEDKYTRVVVPDYQLSLAIGKEGQNARLAARLTGWKIDIKSESQMAEIEASGEAGEDAYFDALDEDADEFYQEELIDQQEPGMESDEPGAEQPVAVGALDTVQGGE
ncbi:MAG: transcription termination/antitermination protein NusA, partial [Clostridia bacterium]|nr:transcription termination/antitermination protein NusA [Clostridia bacterium]